LFRQIEFFTQIRLFLAEVSHLTKDQENVSRQKRFYIFYCDNLRLSSGNFKIDLYLHLHQLQDAGLICIQPLIYILTLFINYCKVVQSYNGNSAS